MSDNAETPVLVYTEPCLTMLKLDDCQRAHTELLILSPLITGCHYVWSLSLTITTQSPFSDSSFEHRQTWFCVD